MRRTILAAAIAALLTLAACGGDDGDDDSAASDDGDGARQLACDDYADLWSDGTAGVLTDAELTERMRDIYDQAELSDDAELTDAAATMVEQANEDDIEGAVRTLESVSDICEE